MNTNYHIPVLTNQVLAFLEPIPGKIFIDATLGTGGHTEEILRRKGIVYGIEIDERNLEVSKERLAGYENVHFIRDSFENLDSIGEAILKKEKRIDGILFDLGLSSLHIEDATRGFSFQREGPLDMRFNRNSPLTAAEIINTYPLEKLFFIFKTYGEEKFSYRIAKQIVEYRRRERFATTSQLADFITSVVPKRFYYKVHPATRVFQALRIAANREIEVLEKGLIGGLEILSPDGRIVVISYHSLEDRLVKHLFREKAHNEVINILTKKPITPDSQEIEMNKKSRSAKLRAAEKL